MVDMQHSLFFYLCDGISVVFYSSFVTDHGLKRYGDMDIWLTKTWHWMALMTSHRIC
jgi:hypothetical protein